MQYNRKCGQIFQIYNKEKLVLIKLNKNIEEKKGLHVWKS